MATINITSQPESLSPTHYPMVWKFNETWLGGGGTWSAIDIIPTGVTNGQTYNFHIANTDPNGSKVTLIARDNPSNGDIPTSAIASLDDITFSIVEALNAHPSFNQFYVAVYSVPGVVGYFSLILSNIYDALIENNLGSAPSSFIFLAGSITQRYFSDTVSSFNVFLDYYDMTNDTNKSYTVPPGPGSSIGLKKARFLRSRNEENSYYFDISDFAKGFIHNDYTPEIKTNTFHYIDGSANAYSIVYGYQYTSGSTFNRVVREGEVTNKWIINASIPFCIQNDSFSGYQTYSARTFLTNQPTEGKIVNLEASSPLAYFHYITGTSTFDVVASIEYTFSDGSVLSALTGHYFATNLQKDYVAYSDVGPANLPIASIEGLFQKEIASYEVWFQRKVLNTFTDILTERKKFILDKSCKDNLKHIHWRNELGGIDSWTFNGKTNQTTDIEQSLYSKFESNPSNKLVSAKSIGKIKRTTKINCSSGWLDEAHYEWMKNSLIGSPKVWINETGNILERIVIVDITVQKDSDNLMHNILITFEQAEYDNHIGK